MTRLLVTTSAGTTIMAYTSIIPTTIPFIHNNFIINTQNAFDYGDNIWDDGEYGNYWSDYKER